MATLINALVAGGQRVAIDTGRADIAVIFIPNLIKVDLSTDIIRFAGNGPNDPRNPDDAGFSRLSIFGNDVLDIAVIALTSDLRAPNNLKVNPLGFTDVDGVTGNELGFNKVFPYGQRRRTGATSSFRDDRE